MDFYVYFCEAFVYIRIMNFMEFIKRYLGWFVAFVIILAIFAPIILTSHGFEYFNKTGTGQIGDTIGGTTAPFWGFLSVILLYITLKEQQRFNQMQKISSDLEVIMKLRDNISELSNNIEVKIINISLGSKRTFKGASYIEQLRSSINSNNGIDEEDFDRLYKNAIEIAELCLLYYNMIIKSSLDDAVKDSFLRAISIHSEMIARLFYLYKSCNINIMSTLYSIDDDLFERYKDSNEKILKRIQDVYQHRDNMH